MNGDLEPGQPCFRELEQVRADGKANCSIPSLRASIQIKFAGGVVCSTADTMEGERSGGSEFRFRNGRPAAWMDRFYGKQSTFLIWRISLHILCALAPGPSPAPARPSLRHLCDGVGVVDRARKARCACFAPKSHINKYGYERTTVTLWRHSWTLLEGSSSYACT